MKQILILFFILGQLLPSWAQTYIKTDITYTQEDNLIFEDLQSILSAKKDIPINELIIEIGKYFIGRPYVAKTLEINQNEKLVVNLQEFDCTTFVENCLALAKTFKSEKCNFRAYTQTLSNIRYRNGECMEYPSRLHYFSEWLLNNEQKENIKLNITKSDIIYPNDLNFMSTHPDSYEALKNNADFVERMKIIEQNISKSSINYIPKEKLPQYLDQLKDGDIIGITTNIKGLDVLHTVLVYHQNGKVHMLHASSAAKKVIISEQTLLEYLNASKIRTGILVGRAL